MKVPLLVLRLLFTVVALRTAQSAESPPPTLDEIPAVLEQLNKDLVTKLDNVTKIVEAESAAGRITDPVAQNLRWTLQMAVSSTGKLQIRSLLTSTRIPTENAAIMTALKEMEAANTTVQSRRTQINEDAGGEIAKRVSTLIKAATKPDECEALERTLNNFRSAMKSDAGSQVSTQSVQNGIWIMQRLSRLLTAEAEGRLEAITAAVTSFRSGNNMYDAAGLSYADAIQERASRALKPLLDATTTAQLNLDEAIEKRKSSAEVAKAFSVFVESCEGFSSLSQRSGRDPENTIPAYQSLLDLIAAADQAETSSLGDKLQQAQSHLSSLGPGRAEKFRTVVSKIEAQSMERADKETQERWSGLQSRLAVAAQAADLDAIAMDLTTWSRESRSRRNQDGGDNWLQLAAEIGSLATAWASPNGGLGQDERFRDNQFRNPAIANTLRELRKRIERDILSRTLNLPELNKAPLLAMETEAALEALADDLATKADWRRLYALTESQMNSRATRGRPSQDDTLNALRSFFAGQNFELAEQWLDAAQAYKEVLRASSRRAPTAAAAEKLKALVKAHPEVIARSSG